MAATPSGITIQSLRVLLRNSELALHRVAAAALTVAFQIAKTDQLSRGERVWDDKLKDEIAKLYSDFLAVADPTLGDQMAQQAAKGRHP